MHQPSARFVIKNLLEEDACRSFQNNGRPSYTYWPANLTFKPADSPALGVAVERICSGPLDSPLLCDGGFQLVLLEPTPNDVHLMAGEEVPRKVLAILLTPTF